MTGAEKYEVAKNKYQEIGVDTDAAIERLSKVPIALHCWQGDDVTGFDHKGPLTGGIQATGNYPGKAGNWKELMQDYDKAMSLMPGKKKLTCTPVTLFLKMENSLTVTSWNLSILPDG